ncbi:MAG TPA: hypothetical protein VF230_14330 [Acidimicrobiales bacterium]
MRGKWERGIQPRNFAWVMRDKLAVSERPGGYARNHRKVRRHEEILWLRNQGFTRVVSLLPSPHNLHAYDEVGVPWSHFPFPVGAEAKAVLAELFPHLRDWVGNGEKLLVHQEELGDRVMGVVAGFLLWGGLVDTGPHAVTVIEQILHRQMGPPGREIVGIAADL